MKTTAILFTLLALALPLIAEAQIPSSSETDEGALARFGKERGGGDDVALAFAAVCREAVEDLRALQEHFPHLSPDDLLKKIEATSFNVTDETIVLADGSTNDPVVENTPATSSLRINRTRVANIRNETLLKAVGLHEILSLAKIEMSGVYRDSAKYYLLRSKMGVNKNSLVNTSTQIALAGIEPNEIDGSNYLAIPKHLNKKQAEAIVAALSAQTEQNLTAVEVRADGESSYVIQTAGANPYKNDEDKPDILGVGEVRASSALPKIAGVVGMKLLRNTMIVAGEVGLGNDADHIGIYTAAQFRVDPLAMTKFPVRPTAGYRVFKLSIDDSPQVNTTGRGPTVGVTIPFSRKGAFYVETMFSQTASSQYNYVRDANGNQVKTQSGKNMLGTPDTVQHHARKKIFTVGLSFTFGH